MTPTTDPTPSTPSLVDAISAVEGASSAYSGAVIKTKADSDIVDGIAAKLNAAQAVVVSDVAAQTDAANSYNAALDTLITAATAAKIPSA